MSEYPDFLIQCDHGIRGVLDDVVIYRWDDGQGAWDAGADHPNVEITYLEGDRPGWWHADGVMGDGSYQSSGKSRVHHEITCPKRDAGCPRQPLRVPEGHLWELFTVIGVNSQFRAGFGGPADAGQPVPVTLLAMHAARREAARLGLLTQR